MDVDRNALMALKMEKLDIPEGIARLESAAAELYKALQASRDTGELSNEILAPAH